MNLSAEFDKKIQIYKVLFKEFNKIHNLSNFKDLDENIKDSLEILNFIDLSKARNIVDVGSGAGFPAIFLSLVLDANFHLFEPNSKKFAFLNMTKIECELSNVKIYKEKIQNHKASFKADFISSRALMKAEPLMEICKNFCDENTNFILWKGSEVEKELKNLQNYQIFTKEKRKFCLIKAQI